MIRQLTLVAALALTSSTVSAENIDPYASPDPPIVSQPYTLNLPCAQCAFSYSDCVENFNLPSFLTITISAENDTLYVNNDPIFPTPILREFQAERHWDASTENVPVAYLLDVQPLSHQPNAVIGDLYRLTLTLVDLQGRTATERPVGVGVVRDSTGNLHIIQVEESKQRRYHHHLPALFKGKSDDNADGDAGGEGSWWRIKEWKTIYVTYFQKMTKERPSVSDSTRVDDETVGVRVHSHPHHRHQRPTGWAADRHYMRHLRPAVVPALLGMAAGILSCVVGFLVGRFVVAVYYCCRARRPDSSDEAETDLEEAVDAEKQRLMRVYGSTES
ncbi:hypothetical protein BJX76DRAFT_258797 [Aspergillus varians]